MSKTYKTIAFLFFSSFFLSSGIALVDKTIHTSVVGAARLDLLSLAEKEIPADELGDWPTTIETVLFMTMRKTELYRGPLRAMVIRDERIIASLYPEGTFILSSGLLDYIDNLLFNDLALGTKRVRNPELEREKLFAPFIITEISRFAVSSHVDAWTRSFSSQGGPQGSDSLFNILKPTSEEIFIADRFSLLLLSIAGYDPTIFLDSLQSMNTESSSPSNTILLEYLSTFPTAVSRIKAITNSGKSPDRLIGEVGNILLSLKTGIALNEGLKSVDQLLLDYSSSSYFIRLKALLAHTLWLKQNEEKYNQLPTLISVAEEARRTEIPLNESDLLNTYTFFPNEQLADKKLWSDAIDSYQKILSIYSDPSIESCYARLLVFSENENDKSKSLQIAEQAAFKEAGTSSLIARTNYASLLVSLSIDTDKALFIFSNIMQENSIHNSKNSIQVSNGMPIHTTDIKKNFIISLISIGEKEKARNLIRENKTIKSNRPIETFTVRSIANGDTTDTLLERWGHPSEIIFNYFTETWIYNDLDASVLIVTDDLTSESPLQISMIRLNTVSPISIGSSIRVGDSRNDFEHYFGIADFKAADSEVYTVSDAQIFVFYLHERIRSISVLFTENKE